MRFSFILLLATATPAFCQPFQFGIRAGVPLTDFVSTGSQLSSNNYDIFKTRVNRYLIGPSAELHLPFGLGVEFDVLYRHLNYSENSGSTGVTSVNTLATTSAGAWEFPLLVKYRFGPKIIHPFVDAGVAWDTLAGLKQDVTSIVGSTNHTSSTSSPSELAQKTTRGYVIGAGIDFKLLLIHVVPEVRFTRWGAEHFTTGLLHTNQNQGEFLLGITF